MIDLCPNCGYVLSNPINCGITNCVNCNRIFDSSTYNRILAASWLARRHHILCEEDLIKQGYSEFESKIVYEYVIEQCYCHDDFLKVLNTIEIPEVA